MFEQKIYQFVASLGNSAGKTKEDIEKATYGLLAIIYTILNFIAVIIIATLTGVLYPTLIAMLTFAVLRNFSGGLHSEHPLGCMAITAIMFPVSGWVTYIIVSSFQEFILPLITVIFVFASLVIFFRAPKDTPQKPITSQRQKIKLRKASLAVAFLSFTCAVLLSNAYPVAAVSLQLGVLLQILMLPPFKLKRSTS